MSHDNHAPSSSSQNAPNTWTEPPWSGWIETTGDALLILEAARRGLIPRVTRRLVDSERKMITSGSVFVFDEDESGIKRWTDGFFWSPSRILGNFLLYRETEKRGAGHRTARQEREVVTEQFGPDGIKIEGQSLSRPKSETNRLGIDRQRERTLVGSLTNSYKFKPGGMMKKTFSLTIGGVAQHLISYYKVEDVEQGRLRSPSTLPELASLDISPEYLDKTHFRNPPKVEIGVDGIPRYRGEADDIETSPSLLTTPLAIPSYDEPASSKRSNTKRYDPYGMPSSSTTASKRPRKPKAALASRSQDSNDEASSPTATTYGTSAAVSPPSSATYPETSLSATTGVPYGSPYGYYQPYPVAPVYASAPYPPPPAPASPITAPPQQSPTPPQQGPAMTYTGFTPSNDSPSGSQSQSQASAAPYPPPYYVPHHPPAHAYGAYQPMWTHYPGSGYPGAQSNERVHKQEREDSV